MVWNGILADFSGPAGSGGRERSDLRDVVFGDVGRDFLHGPHDFWWRSPCGLCGGDFKPTSLDRLDDSSRNPRRMKDFLSFEVRRRNNRLCLLPQFRGGLIKEWDFINDMSQMPRNDAG